jgi:biopolymer transport protein ExbB
VTTSFPLLPALSGLLLLLLSVAVLTVVIERLRWWGRWWQKRHQRNASWTQRLAFPGVERPELEQTLEDWDREMRWGEPLMQAAAVLAPLLGLIGTVTALMGVLAQLGPRLELPAGASLASYGQVLLSTAAGLVVSLIATAALLASQALRDWQIAGLRRQLRRSVGPAR